MRNLVTTARCVALLVLIVGGMMAVAATWPGTCYRRTPPSSSRRPRPTCKAAGGRRRGPPCGGWNGGECQHRPTGSFARGRRPGPETTPARCEELGGIADDPKLASQALYMTGLIERRRGRVRYAEAAYRKAIGAHPGSSSAARSCSTSSACSSAAARSTPSSRPSPDRAALEYDLYVWGLTHFVSGGRKAPRTSSHSSTPIRTIDTADWPWRRSS